MPDLTQQPGLVIQQRTGDLGSTVRHILHSSDELILASLLEDDESLKRDEPLSRWLKYQFYIGFIQYIEKKYGWPEGFEVYRPNENELRVWIGGETGRVIEIKIKGVIEGQIGHVVKAEVKGTTDLWEKLRTKLTELLQALKKGGTQAYEDLCQEYRKLLEKIKDSQKRVEGALATFDIALKHEYIHEFLFAYSGDFLYAGGIPITTFLLLFIKLGLIDELKELCSEEDS